MSLPPRKIGNASVNPIGFGAMGISKFYGSVGTDEERLQVLDAAYEKGCTHWDSPDAYGDSEILIGKWLKRTGKRNEIFLTSKFGFTSDGIRGDAEHVRKQCSKSLERFGVDTIDLYYQHRVDPKVPIELTVGAMAELVKEGKIKYLGLSECSAEDMRRAHTIHPISAIQVEFSPFVLDIEDEQLAILKTARELGITVVVYSSLARGLITGQIKSPDDFEEGDFRLTIPKFTKKENFPKILEVVDRLKGIGAKHNATPGQVTLAWILAQGDDFVIIPGTKKVKYLKENAGAAAVKLSLEEIVSIRQIAVEANKIPGARYGPVSMKNVLVPTPPLPK